MAGEIKLVVPEVIVFETIKTMLKLIEDDFNANASNEPNSILYRILNSDIRLQRYNFYEQGKKVFVTKIDDPRRLDVNMFFNLKRAALPTIHVVFPGETAGVGGLNIDEGFQLPITDTDTMLYRNVYSRRFDSSVKIFFTSDNTNEVIVMYHLMRAMLIPVFNHLNMAGLEECAMGGGDVPINSELVPAHIFFREINLFFKYDVNVMDFYDKNYINNLFFTFNPVSS